jgi:hypothetical protein
MSIIVLTHNGRLPRDGGLRIGYQCGDLVLMPGGPYSARALLAASQPPPKQQKPAATTLLSLNWFDLEQMASDGWCTWCQRIGVPHPLVEKGTSAGPRMLHYCPSTGHYLRQRISR